MDPSQMQDFPPSYSQSTRKGGYSALPQDDPYGPPAGYSAPAPPPSAYAPAPSVFQQQISNTNVVVVNQPAAQPSVVHVSPPHANKYMFLTAIMMVLCILLGNFPAVILCLVPALICSLMARDHNRAGDHRRANSCGEHALSCNVIAVFYFVVLIYVTVVLVSVYGRIGFEAAKNIIDDFPTASPYIYCCNQYSSGICSQYCTNECYTRDNVCIPS